MGLLGWIILGALAGWIASMIVGNNSEQGAMGNIVTGIIGAISGGFLANVLGGSAVSGFNLYSLGVAIAGASAVIYIKEKMAA